MLHSVGWRGGHQPLVSGQPDVPRRHSRVDVLRLRQRLVDLTAVHWPEKEQPFELIWILYSFDKNVRMRIKASIAEGEKIPSIVSLHTTANSTK